MSRPITDLAQLLRDMQPTLHEGVYAFVTLPPGSDGAALDAIGTFREAEGLTGVVEEQRARDAGLPVLFRAAWITLQVHSHLQAVGLTAAVAGALAQAGISCNVVAAACHDHVFVPVESAPAALATLRRLQQRRAAPDGWLRRCRDIALTLVGGLLLYIAVLTVLYQVGKGHWLFGSVATVLYALAVALGLADLQGEWARRLPIHKGVGLVLLVGFTAVAVAASASYQLLRAGWAAYEPAPPLETAYLNLNGYYLWLLLDMLPGLDAATTLSLAAPMTPVNWVAGLPVLGFRVFIVFGLLAGIKAWWAGKRLGA